MKIDSAKYHSTECELAYLEKIGSWRSGITLSRSERQKYLKGYLRGVKQRVNWGMVKREVVLERVEEEIDNLAN